MKVNGRELAVEVDGQGPAVLFVHGLAGTSNFYQAQADVLADRFRVIRVDSAGAGRSPDSGAVSIESHADDLAAVLDRLDVDRAAVVGHSMGTLVARALDTRHPGRVSALAFLGATRGPRDVDRTMLRDLAGVIRENGPAAVAADVVASGVSETTRRERPEIAAFVRELVMRQDPQGYARNCEALAAANDPGPVPPELRLLLVTGDADLVGPPDVSRAIGEDHGNATVEILAGVGHWTAVEAAGPTTTHLLDFL